MSTKPDDIPQDVWNAAEAIHREHAPSFGGMDVTARAILAERERCAKLADARRFDDHELAQATDWGLGAHTTATELARDIRNGGA